MISIGGAGARGTNGTLSPATARTRSGWIQRHPPDHEGAPVVPDEDRALLVERVEQADHVGAQRRHVVGLDLRGRRRAAVAAHVGHDHAVAGLGERRDLMAPGERQLGEAVAEDDGGAAAGLVDVQLDPLADSPRARAGGIAALISPAPCPAQ